MPSLKLTNKFVNNVTCNPDEGPGKVTYYDRVAQGLVLEVHATGRKTFFFRYLDSYGKVRQPKICNVKELTLANVRKQVMRYRGQLALDLDPFEEKRDKRNVPTLGEFVEAQYMPYIKNYKRSWVTDECLLRRHVIPLLGERHMDAIKKNHILDVVYRHKEKHKPASTNRIIILLKYIYNLAMKWEVEGVNENPVLGVPLFEENNQRERYLQSDEVQRLMAAMEDSRNACLKPMVLMLLLTGARRGELLAAKWEELDFVRKIWTVPVNKSGKARYIPMSDQLVDLLLELKKQASGAHIFVNEATGKPFTNFFYAWDAARKKAGMPELRVHDLRHSFASFLVNGGRGIYEVQKILGHTQIKTTQRYAHLSNESLISAANEAGRQILTGDIDGAAR
jgi:integrase